MIVLSRSKNAASITPQRTSHDTSSGPLDASVACGRNVAALPPPFPGVFTARDRVRVDAPLRRALRGGLVLVCCWSPKGGSGTSVVRGRVRTRCSPARAGLASPISTATSPRSSGSPPIPPTGLARLAARSGSTRRPTRSTGSRSTRRRRLTLLPAGRRRPRAASRRRPAPRSRSRCASTRRRRSSTSACRARRALDALLEVADATVVVVRGCYLALRRAVRMPADGATRRVRCSSRSPAARSARATSPTCSASRCSRRCRCDRRSHAWSTPACSRPGCPTRSPKPAREVLAAHRLLRPRGPRRVTLEPHRSDRSTMRCAPRCTGACSRPRSIRVRSTAPSCAPGSRSVLRDEAPLCPPARRRARARRARRRRRRPRAARALLADPDVSEIMVNGPRPRVRRARTGGSSRSTSRLDAAAIARLAERVVAPLGLRLDHASPIVDARLPDGSRLHAVLPPLAPDGPCLTIRRFVARDVGARRVRRRRGAVAAPRGDGAGGLEPARRRARRARARRRCATRSPGRSTPASASSRSRRPRSCALPQPHVVRLEARPANAEGVGAVPVRELVRAALRMRPDRLIVGEVRGGEALDMLQALNTGHDGSLSTVHANGPAARARPARDARAARRASRSRSPRSGRRSRRPSTRSSTSRAARDGRRGSSPGRRGRRARRVDARVVLARGDGAARARVDAPPRPARRAEVDLAEAWRR